MYNLENNKNETSLFDFFDNMLDGVFAKDMKTDIEETDNAYNLSVEVPGVAKENIEISLEDNTLTINVKNESKKDSKEYLQKERVFMNMSRKYYLENSDPEAIKAKLTDGILTISVGKVKSTLPEKRTISIE